MNDRKIVVTRRVPTAGIDLLQKEGFEPVYNDEDRALSRSEFLEWIQAADGILSMLHDRIDPEALDVCPNVQVVSNYAVGFNNIDLEACRQRNVRVTNTPDVLTDATADMAFTLLMAAARRVVESDQYLRRGEWTGWSPMQFLGADITGRTLGIIGAGRIGRAMAARAARGFGMKILYSEEERSSSLAEWEASIGAKQVDLDVLLAESDFVSVHCPLTDQTKHLIGKKQLESMKPSAILINTARGPIVDEKALVEALRSGTIAGAGLDVFEEEPRIEPGLVDLPNTVLVPHLGSATIQTRSDMSELAARNLIAVLKGQEPPCAVV